MWLYTLEKSAGGFPTNESVMWPLLHIFSVILLHFYVSSVTYIHEKYVVISLQQTY